MNIASSFLTSLNKLCTHRYFLFGIYGLFVIQAIIIALIIGKNIFPDEHRHLGFILYYASAPFGSWPIISSQPIETMWIGDMVRFPSFLYYYLASFPVRIIQFFSTSESLIIIALRFLNILIGLASLAVFERILARLNIGTLVRNIAVLCLSLTGMFVYIHAGITYDPLSILLFLLSTFFAIGVIKSQSLSQLAMYLLASAALSIVKYTYLPIIGISLIFVVINIYIHRAEVKGLWSSQRAELWKNSKMVAIAVIVAGLVLGSLSLYRHGSNLIEFGSVNPPCQQVHSHDMCMGFEIYQRNYQQKQILLEQTLSWGREPTDLFALTGDWLEHMYRTIFYFGGNVWAYLGQTERIIGFVLVVACLALCLLPRRAALTSLAQRYVLLITLSQIVTVYLFNIYIWYVFGARFAWQGRYQLPILGFVYLILILIAMGHLNSIKSKKLKLYATTSTVVVFIAILLYLNSITSFIIHHEISWFNYPIQQWLYSR